MKKLDTALLKLEVPDKSFHVSKAPPTERFTDEWTNVKLSKPKPGDLFNRRECSWYLSAKHKDAVLWLGLIAYAKENYTLSKSFWEKLYELDGHFKESELAPHGSTPARLLWNIKNNKGGLYVRKNEAAVFKSPRSRFLLLIADVELECANLQEGERKYRRIIDDKEISSNKEQLAYCKFALAVTLLGQFKTEEGLGLLHDFLPGKSFHETRIAPRALLYLANNIEMSSKVESPVKKRESIYLHIIKQFPKSGEAESAAFYLGEMFHYLESYDKAESYFGKYVKSYPKGRFHNIAAEKLKEIEQTPRKR